MEPFTNKTLLWPTKKNGFVVICPFRDVEIGCLWSMEFVYNNQQKWALHGLAQKGICSCTEGLQQGKTILRMQTRLQDGSIRKPKTSKQSIYARCYLNIACHWFDIYIYIYIYIELLCPFLAFAAFFVQPDFVRVNSLASPAPFLQRYHALEYIYNRYLFYCIYLQRYLFFSFAFE